MELTHIWLLVEDMPRALDFYRDKLGLAVAADLGGFVELNANEHFLLSLFLRSAMRESEPGIPLSPVTGQHAALVFEVKGLGAYCADLRVKGAEFASAEADHSEWGLRTAFLRDPDGNLLCLYEGLATEETAVAE
ncbi:MAG TPA: VOC family protein [Ktedonobacterales bacterium]|jgi:catechol 2,3-dioxygenase-like lactoylglutathione lyase family enzyme